MQTNLFLTGPSHIFSKWGLQLACTARFSDGGPDFLSSGWVIGDILMIYFSKMRNF